MDFHVCFFEFIFLITMCINSTRQLRNINAAFGTTALYQSPQNFNFFLLEIDVFRRLKSEAVKINLQKC